MCLLVYCFRRHRLQLPTEILSAEIKAVQFMTWSCCAMQITNGAVHAKWAVVFAQLHIGGKNEGIHGFLVRIRNEVHHPLSNNSETV